MPGSGGASDPSAQTAGSWSNSAGGSPGSAGSPWSVAGSPGSGSGSGAAQGSGFAPPPPQGAAPSSGTQGAYMMAGQGKSIS